MLHPVGSDPQIAPWIIAQVFGGIRPCLPLWGEGGIRRLTQAGWRMRCCRGCGKRGGIWGNGTFPLPVAEEGKDPFPW